MKRKQLVIGLSIVAGVIGLGSNLGGRRAFAADDAAAKPYKVVDGYKVDHNTMEGFRAWRAAACDRCHGANQEGLVGPSLIESLKTLSKADFKKTVTEGRLDKGMPTWSSNQMVMSNLDNLYSYLKGRSDGAITKARVEEIKDGAP
ncbi:MAG: cytochrome c [Burkholderiaceae bacterium]|jgi:mono/diheme cytochrome c family protein